MIKDIVKDDFFLSQLSVAASKEDSYIINDLKDTLEAHKEGCVGMAANMIGYLKTIMIINDDGTPLILVNPQYLKKEHPYQTKEGCLSHDGEKETQRYDLIKISYLDEDFKKRIRTFKGYSAQIIQHEYDHFLGILI